MPFRLDGWLGSALGSAKEQVQGRARSLDVFPESAAGSHESARCLDRGRLDVAEQVAEEAADAAAIILIAVDDRSRHLPSPRPLP